MAKTKNSMMASKVSFQLPAEVQLIKEPSLSPGLKPPKISVEKSADKDEMKSAKSFKSSLSTKSLKSNKSKDEAKIKSESLSPSLR